MRRRTYLTGSLGALAGLAGCSGILDSDDSDADDSDSESNDDPDSDATTNSSSDSDDDPSGGDLGPAETVDAFYEAIFAGDVDEANQYIHPDGEVEELTQSRVDQINGSNPTIDDTTVTERDDDVATVSLEATVDSDGERRSVEGSFGLRKFDGEWLIYEEQPGDSGGDPNAPVVQWDVEERVGDGGETTAVAFQHSGGEVVDVERLGVAVGEAVVGSEEAGELQTADTVVAPFSAGDEGYDAGTTVALRWNDPESEVQTLVTYELENQAAGELGADFSVE